MVAAVRGAVVAFGVDSYDPGTETGWSVTVVGPSRVLVDPEQFVRRPRGRPARTWADPGRCLITVQVGLLRGWSSRDTEPRRPLPPARTFRPLKGRATLGARRR